MIILRKDEKQGSFAYVPEFKRVNMKEYQQYKQNFAMEIDTCFNGEEREERKKDKDNNVIFSRVIKIDFDKNKNKRRRLEVDIDDDENGPSRKRQKM